MLGLGVSGERSMGNNGDICNIICNILNNEEFFKKEKLFLSGSVTPLTISTLIKIKKYFHKQNVYTKTCISKLDLPTLIYKMLPIELFP